MNRSYLAGGAILFTVVLTAATYGLAPVVAIVLFVIGMALSAIIFGLNRVYEASADAVHTERPANDAGAAWLFPAALVATVLIIGIMMAGLRQLDDGRARMRRDAPVEFQPPPAEQGREVQLP